MVVKLKSQHAGFTIIETMFAIAIGGIIILLVFEAIPALNRSGHNHSRRQDVATILEAVSHYEVSHSGNVPDSCYGDVDDPPNDLLGCKTAFLGNTQLKFYPMTDITFTPQSSDSSATYTSGSFLPETRDTIVSVTNYHRCNESVDKNTQNAAGYFDVIALYFVEKSGGQYELQCQQL
jgi:prepilin-type N-terminal cleavage/methylation domain-containing protein